MKNVNFKKIVNFWKNVNLYKMHKMWIYEKMWIFEKMWFSRKDENLFTFSCSDSAWKVCTETICWKRLRLIRMNAFSSLAILASAVLTSWIKNLSRDKGCLYTTYFMPCNPSLVTLECSFTAGEGQFSPRLDFCNREDEKNLFNFWHKSAIFHVFSSL